MTRDEQKRALRRMREILPEASSDPRFEVVDGVETLVARPIARAPHAPIVTFTAESSWMDRELYLHALDWLTMLLVLYDEACDVIRRLRPAEPKPEKQPDYAAQCAMLCDKPAFQRFLTEMHGLENQNRDAAASRVRSMLNIPTRATLNHNPAAAAGWKKLAGEYEAWKRT